MPPITPIAKLGLLRELMSKYSVDAYIVPTADSHNSEYPSAFHQRRQYISNFTGSAGTAVITKKEALLWTDGRYFIQADEELDNSCWTLMKDGTPDCVPFPTWIKKNEEIKTAGADSFTLSVGAWKDLTTGDKVKYVSIAENLVDTVWSAETDPKYIHPTLPMHPITVHSVELAGKGVKDKLLDLRADMSKADPSYNTLLLTETPDVAWLFNLRGHDFDFNPMFLSYAIITQEFTRLYCHDTKLTSEAKTHLADNSVTIRHYDSIITDLQELISSASSVIMHPAVCVALHKIAEDKKANILLKTSSVNLAKSIKNKTEIGEFKEGHIQDAIALCTYINWLETSAVDVSILKENEFSVATYLEKLRNQQPFNRGLSFPSISSIDSNGAVIHYKPPAVGSKPMTNGVYLIDSGGQYRGSTTDVTRTLHLGTPTKFQQECWTRVLKGHIALARCVFPKGTRGPQLDILARMYLWEAGLNYLHGTGHGVGAYLSVHEGPCGISNQMKGVAAETVLEEGMVLSNEPGYYLAGQFGIRHENLMHVVKLEPKSINPSPVDKPDDQVPYFGFENLTLVPFQKKFALLTLLSKEEIDYINSYHKQCWNTLSNRIKDDDVSSWLRNATLPWDEHVHKD